MDLIKAHAYGNDFLFVRQEALHGSDTAALARRLCERHRGVGADGLIVYRPTEDGAVMRLYNPDGGVAEISGNGLRCLAAIVARGRAPAARTRPVLIETDAGVKRLDLLEVAGPRYTFVAEMGEPERLRQVQLKAAGTTVDAIVMSMGNPQCVLLEPALSLDRLHSVGAALAVHPYFPAGTNVELACVDDSVRVGTGRVSILIWERGVGPTEASGTGACAAAVAAIRFGGAPPRVEVVSPGGRQLVEWRATGIALTGWAEVSFTAQWDWAAT
jgi:diaminopimelate epimerase